MTQGLIGELETPCLVIDLKKTERNIRMMQEAVGAAGCLLRPHIKTHKMSRFARMQIEAGANGITCAKVSEAEVMADGGIWDIFIAYPMVGEFRIRRAMALLNRVDRLILAVDSVEGAAMLQRCAQEAGKRVEVRLEIDTGAKRTGVKQNRLLETARYISEQPNLQMTGIYTFKGLTLNGEPTMDHAAAAEEEGLLMQKAVRLMKREGIPVREISAGSTPTGIEVAQTGCVTEVRPGTYIFKDYMLTLEGAAKPEEIAVRYFATVVSTPCPEYAVIDGGTKTFPMDVSLNVPPCYYPGYAIVEGRPDLRLCRMNEEHGILTSETGDTGLRPGQKLCLIPIHVCTAINMQNEVYIDCGDHIEKERVEARGMLV